MIKAKNTVLEDFVESPEKFMREASSRINNMDTVGN
jgi:hypothetical protein